MANPTIKGNIDLLLNVANVSGLEKSASKAIQKQLKSATRKGAKHPLDIDLGFNPDSPAGVAQIKRLQRYKNKLDGIINKAPKGAEGDKLKSTAATLGNVAKSAEGFLQTITDKAPTPGKLKTYREALQSGADIFKGKSKSQVATLKKNLEEVQAHQATLLKRQRSFQSEIFKPSTTKSGKDGAVVAAYRAQSTALEAEISRRSKILNSGKLKEALDFGSPKQREAHQKAVEAGHKREAKAQKKAEEARLVRAKRSEAARSKFTIDSRAELSKHLFTTDQKRLKKLSGSELGQLEHLSEQKSRIARNKANKLAGEINRLDEGQRKTKKQNRLNELNSELSEQKDHLKKLRALNKGRERVSGARGLTAHERSGRDVLQRAGGLGAITAVDKRDLKSVNDYLTRHNQLLDRRQKKLAALRDISAGRGQVNRANRLNQAYLKTGETLQQVSQALSDGNARMRGFTGFTHQAALALRLFFRYAIAYGALYKVLEAVKALTGGLVTLDERLHSIRAISAATVGEMSKIKAAIKSVSVTTQFDVSEIAGSAQTLAQAGVKPEEMAEALQSVALFASATNSTLETSADLISTMRNVFTDLSDKTIADQLTKAVNISKLTGKDLSTILSRGLQVANAYNVTSDQFLAAVTVLRNAGIKASTVSTGLRQSLLELLSPDAKTIAVLKERYNAIGTDLGADEIRAKFFGFTQDANPLLSVLREIKKLGAGSGSGKAAFSRVFDVRAANVINVLLKDLDKLDDSLARLSSGGAASKGAEIQMLSFSNSMKNLGAVILSVSDTLSGDFVQSLAESTRGLTEFIKSYEDAVLKKQALGQGADGLIAGSGAIAAGTFVRSSGGIGSRLAKGAAAGGAALFTGNAASKFADENLGSDVAGFVTKAIATAASVYGFFRVFGGSDLTRRLGISKKLLGKSAGSITALKKVASLLLGVFKLHPIIKIITVIAAVTEIFSAIFGEAESAQSQLDAALQRKAKAQAKKDATLEAFKAVDPEEAGSDASRLAKLGVDLTSESLGIAGKLEVNPNELSKIQTQLNALGDTVVDSASTAFETLKEEIEDKLGKPVSPEALQGVLDIRIKARSAENQIKTRVKEYRHLLSELAFLDKRTAFQEAQLQAISAELREGGLSFNDSILEQFKSIIDIQNAIKSRGVELENEIDPELRKIRRTAADKSIRVSRESTGVQRQSRIQAISVTRGEDLQDLSASNNRSASINTRADDVTTAIADAIAAEVKEKAVAYTKSQDRHSSALETYNSLIEEGKTNPGIQAIIGTVTKPGPNATDPQKAKFNKDVAGATQQIGQFKTAEARKAREATFIPSFDTKRTVLGIEDALVTAKKSKNLSSISELSIKRDKLLLAELNSEIEFYETKKKGSFPKDTISKEAKKNQELLDKAGLAKAKLQLKVNQDADSRQRELAKKTFGEQNTKDQLLVDKNKILIDELVAGSEERLELQNETLEVEKRILGRKYALELASSGDVQNAKTRKEQDEAAIDRADRKAKLDDQLHKSEVTLRDAQRLTASQAAFKAKAGVLSRADRSANAQNVLTGLESQRDSQLAISVGGGTDTDKEAAKAAVADLNNEIAVLQESLDRMNSSVGEQFLQGFNLDVINAKLQQSGVNIENLATTVQDKLVSAFDNVADAVADAVVDGKDLLESLKTITYETSRAIAKDFVKAKFKEFILGPLAGTTADQPSNPQQVFSTAVTSFGAWVQRLTGTGPVLDPTNTNHEIPFPTGSDDIEGEIEQAGQPSVFDPILQPFKDGFAKLFTDEGAIFKPVTEMFKGIFSTGSELYGTITGLLDTVFGGIGKGAGSFGFTGGGGGSGLFKIASAGLSLAGMGLGSMMSGIGGLFSGTTAAAAASSAVGGIGSTAGAAYEAGLVASGLPIGKFAAGGVIKGKGTGTSDSNLIRVSDGEAVLNARAVAALGESGVNQLNSAVLTKSLSSGESSSKFVPGSQSSTTEPPIVESNTRIINVLDPSLAADYLDSSSGEKAIVNVIKRNSGAVRQLLS